MNNHGIWRVLRLPARIRAALIDIIAPPMCSYCKIFLSERRHFCDRCLAMITPVASLAIPLTSAYTVKVFAVSAYQEPLRSLILAKQWSDVCASTKLGELIWQMSYANQQPIDYLVPIPLHWVRFAQRGYNQAEEMAHALAQASGKPVACLLKRTKRTPFQSNLSAQARSANVRNAFELSTAYPHQYAGKHLVIVDDLMTTGSTIHAAARELAKLKPASITVFVACRVI